jgi:RNA polymerase sigma factor (sigma-70 family)
MSRSLRSSFASDERLVKKCLKGNEEAWTALLDKYRSLIYSIPLRHSLSDEDASDIFQQVCVQLLRHLGTIRDAQSLAAWLIKVTTRMCFYWISKERRFEPGDMDTDWGPAPEVPEQLMKELEQEQVLHEAMAHLKPRCRALLHMLFFEIPPIPYATVANKLGLATGSIGFIRMNCLQKLRQQLEARGFA